MLKNWKDLSPSQRRDEFIKIYSNQSYPAGRSHGTIKLARKLSQKANKNKKTNYYQVFIESLPIIKMALKYEVEIETFIVCPEEIYSQEVLELLPDLLSEADTSLDVSEKTFSYITNKGNSNGLAAIVRMKDKSLSDLEATNDLLVVLDGLETPGNIGSIIRSADAVDAKGIIITNQDAHLFHPLMIRSSRGICFNLPLVASSVEETKEFLSKYNYEIVLAEPDAKKYYYKHCYKAPTALVMGSERFGIDKKWFEGEYTGVSIPMLGDCDSLNVSIATTVLLYEIRLQKDKEIKR